MENDIDRAVQDVLAELQAAGIAPEDLDDLVHDLADENGAAEANQGSDEAAEDVIDRHSASASDVNNGGLESQVRFVLAECGVEDGRSRLREAAGLSDAPTI